MTFFRVRGLLLSSSFAGLVMAGVSVAAPDGSSEAPPESPRELIATSDGGPASEGEGGEEETSHERFVKEFDPRVLHEGVKVGARAARNWYHLTYPTGTLPDRPFEKAREHVRRFVRDVGPWAGPGLRAPDGGLAGRALVDPGTNVWVEYGPKPLDATGTTNNAFQYGIVSGRLNAIVSDPTNRGSGAGDRAWLGFAGGGLWRVDGIRSGCPGGVCNPANITITPMWEDRDQVTQTVSAIEIDPHDASGDTVYVGTGDWMADDHFSSGILRTTDGGATWTQLAEDVFTPYSVVLPPNQANGGCVGCLGNRWSTQNIKAVRVDPNDATTLLVGTARDLYLSNDSGSTWEICAFGNGYTNPERTSGSVAQVNQISGLHLDDVGATTRAYVAVGWVADANNDNNGVFSFTVPASGCPAWPGDFTSHNTGLPGLSTRGRIELAAHGTGANLLLYAQVQDATNFNAEGIFALKPNDGSWSNTWRTVTSGTAPWGTCGAASSTTDQDWYDLHIAVDPTNDKNVFAGHVDLFRLTVNSGYNGTSSGPTNLSNVYATSCPEYGLVHPDQHSFAFVAGTPSQWVLVGNDGGIYLNTNNGAASAWTPLSGAGAGVSTNQFYAGQIGMNFGGTDIDMDGLEPSEYGNPTDNRQWILGGMQDNGSASWDSSTSGLQWTARGRGGDGMWAAFDSYGGTETTGYWITETQNGNVQCSSGGADGPFGNCLPGWAAGESQDWSTPIVMDQYHCDTSPTRCTNALAAGDHVYASTAYGTASWTRVTTSAGMLPGSASAGSVVSLATARSSATSALAGTDNGRLWWSGNVFNCGATVPNTATFACSANGSATWERIDSTNSVLPNRVVAGVAFAPDTDQVVYAAISGFAVNTTSTPAHIIRAVRTGTNTWTVEDKTGNLPDVPFEAVAANPNNPNQVFAGSQFGFYYTDDITVGSPTWVRYMEGPLPNARITHFSLDRGHATTPLASTTLAAFTYGRGVYAIRLPAAGESFCTTKPSAPSGVAAVADAANRITVSWNDSATAGATEYDLYRASGSGGPYTFVTTVADTSPGVGGSGTYQHHETGVTAGETRYYVVRAVEGNGCSSVASSEASATAFGDCTAPPTFAGLQGVAALGGGQGCGLRLTWNAGTSSCGGEVVYNVYRSTSAGFTPGSGNLVASCVADTAWDDTTLAVDTTYHYAVRAEDSGAVGAGSCGVGLEETNSTKVSGIRSSAGVQTLYGSDFESGTAEWVAVSFGSGTSSWQATPQDCRGVAGDEQLRFGGASCTADYNSANFQGYSPRPSGGPITVPAGATDTVLSFDHGWQFEYSSGNGRYYDGGTLGLSLNGSNYSLVQGSSILSGPSYNGTIYSGAGSCAPSGSGGIPIWGDVQAGLASQQVDLDPTCDAICTGGSPPAVCSTNYTSGCANLPLYLAWIGITDCNTTRDGWFVDNVSVTADSGGSACSAAPNDVRFLTARGTSTRVDLEWMNPSAGNYGSTTLRTGPAGFPSDPTAGSALTTQNNVSGGHGTAAHTALTNGSTHYYSAFVDGGGGTFSGRQMTRGYPVATAGNLKWNFSTQAAALATPIQWSGIGVYAASNTRALHAMSGGATGGTWPSGWTPLAMNAPAQGQPLVLPAAWTGLGHDAVFATSQDGRVYCRDTATGAACAGWNGPDTSPSTSDDGTSVGSFGMLQATAIPYLGSTGATSTARWMLVGSRDASGAAHGLHAVRIADGTTAWSFTNSGAQGGNGQTIGIVNGTAHASPSTQRITFASRVRSGGSANTLWSLDVSSGSPQLDWAQALGDIDSSVTRDHSRNRLIVATAAGAIHSVPAGGGAGTSRSFGDGGAKDFVSYDAVRDRLLFATETAVRAIPADLGVTGSDWVVGGLSSPTRPLLHFGTTRTYVGACGATCDIGRLIELDAADSWGTPKTYDLSGVGGLGSVIIDRSQSPALLHAGSRSGRIVAVQVPLP